MYRPVVSRAEPIDLKRLRVIGMVGFCLFPTYTARFSNNVPPRNVDVQSRPSFGLDLLLRRKISIFLAVFPHVCCVTRATLRTLWSSNGCATRTQSPHSLHVLCSSRPCNMVVKHLDL